MEVYEPGHQYIYIIACGKFRKIGRAVRPMSRLASLQTGNPEQCVLEYARPLLDETIKAAEAAAHRILQGFRVRGEWFFCSKQDAIAGIRMGCRQVIDERAVRSGLFARLRAEADADVTLGDDYAE